MARGPAHWFKSATRDGLRGHGAPRPPIFVRGTIRLGTPAVSALRGPRSFSQLLQGVIQDAPGPTRRAVRRRGLDITPSMATSSSTSNYCLKTWPPRFGRFHLLLVMYTMDMELLSSRRLLLSVWNMELRRRRRARLFFIWQQILLRGLA